MPTIDISEIQKLDQFASLQSEILYSLKGIFPFDFFPNIVTIYRDKISIVKKTFLWTGNSTNIPMENINYVTIHANLFFATLEISDRYFSEAPILIPHLWRKEAEYAMRLIDGLRLSILQDISLTKIPKDELIKRILKIGVISDVPTPQSEPSRKI